MDNNTKVDIWNQFYTEKGRYYHVPHEDIKRAIKIFKDNDVKKILDLGCGSGRHIIKLAEEDFEVVGVDYAPAAVDLAQKWILSKDVDAKAYIANIHDEISFIKAGNYDAVLGIKSLNFTDLNTFRKTIHEVNRILKKGGFFYVVVPTIKSVFKDVQMQQLYFTEDEIVDILDESFDIVEKSIDHENFISIIAKEK